MIPELRWLFAGGWLRRCLTLAAAAAIGLTAGTDLPTEAAETNLRIAWMRTQTTLPYFVIKEQRLDKKHGLQFSETLYEGGAKIIDDAAAGTIDVSVNAGSVPVFLAAERGLIPGKVVVAGSSGVADPDHPNNSVIAAHSIKGWKDLTGKKLAVNATVGFGTMALRLRFKQEGVEKYELVELAFPNMGLAVAGGNVAAAAMNEPYHTQSLLRGDGKLLGWIVGGPPFERFPLTMVIFGAGFYRADPEGTRRFFRAYLEAVQWINKNPEQARLVLAKHLQLSRQVAQNIKLHIFPHEARNDPVLLEATQRALVEAGFLKTQIPAKQLYDEALLEDVLKRRN